MLRIDEDRTARPGGVVLRLEGKLVGNWVSELRRAAASALDRGVGGLTLDLGGLSFADHAGTALLGELAADGVSLTNCSPFAAAQLRDADIGCKVE